MSTRCLVQHFLNLILLYRVDGHITRINGKPRPVFPARTSRLQHILPAAGRDGICVGHPFVQDLHRREAGVESNKVRFRLEWTHWVEKPSFMDASMALLNLHPHRGYRRPR